MDTSKGYLQLKQQSRSLLTAPGGLVVHTVRVPHHSADFDIGLGPNDPYGMHWQAEELMSSSEKRQVHD
jgi:hypothetical protein